MRPENIAGMLSLTPELMAGSPQESAWHSVAPNPVGWGTFLSKIGPMQRDFKGWPAEEIRAIPAPTLLVYAGNDAIPLEHVVELYRLRGGNVNGDFEGLPASRLAILPGTTHTGIMDCTDQHLPLVSAHFDADTA
jgi:pimeloyl-ACP methyl ester carboxylesterase